MSQSSWASTRRSLNELIRRSRNVSANAYRLWNELAYGWAWAEPVCYPRLEVLAECLGCHRNSVSKYLDELVTLGLVIRRRRLAGYHLTLVTEIPKSFATRSNNREIAAEVERRKSLSHNNAQDVVHPYAQDVVHDSGNSSEINGLRKKVTDRRKSLSCNNAQDVVHPYAQDVVHPHAQDVVHPYAQDVVQEDGTSEAREKKLDKGKMSRKPEASASGDNKALTGDDGRCAPGTEHRPDHGEHVSYVNSDEIEGLMAEEGDPAPSRSTRRKKRRSADAALVSSVGRGGSPFPNEQGSSQKKHLVKYEAGPIPPPVDSPSSLVWLLRGEVESKWGQKGSRGFPMELTRDLSGKIDKVILRKYAPDVILAMTRLLVWDWEVAREVCFPFRRDAPFPDALAFVQYAKELATRIETGFHRGTNHRGDPNSYYNLFIEKRDRVIDDDPF